MIDKDAWIKETQMFQRIAKVNEESYANLSDVWDKMKNNKVKKRALQHIKTHRTIQDVAKGSIQPKE